jgi:hypothetical protein
MGGGGGEGEAASWGGGGGWGDLYVRGPEKPVYRTLCVNIQHTTYLHNTSYQYQAHKGKYKFAAQKCSFKITDTKIKFLLWIQACTYTTTIYTVMLLYLDFLTTVFLYLVMTLALKKNPKSCISLEIRLCSVTCRSATLPLIMPNGSESHHPFCLSPGTDSLRYDSE